MEIRKFTLTHFWEKNPQSNDLVLLPKELISRIFFFSEREFFVFPHCGIGKVLQNAIMPKQFPWNQIRWFHGKYCEFILLHVACFSPHFAHFHPMHFDRNILRYFHGKWKGWKKKMLSRALISRNFHLDKSFLRTSLNIFKRKSRMSKSL